MTHRQGSGQGRFRRPRACLFVLAAGRDRLGPCPEPAGLADSLPPQPSACLRPQPVAVFGADERVPCPPAVQGPAGQDGPAVQPALAHGVHGVLRRPGHRGDGGALPVSDCRASARRASRTSGSPATTMRCATTRASPATRPAAAAQHVISGAATLNMRPPIDATKDWAFVRLARAICTRGCCRSAAANRSRSSPRRPPSACSRCRTIATSRPGSWPMRSPATISPQFRRRGVENDRGGFFRSRRAAAAHLRHGRRLVGLAAAAGNGARDRR